MNNRALKRTAVILLLAATGPALAQPSPCQLDDVALIHPATVRWWMDANCDGLFELGGNPQWGLPSDLHFLAGEPYANGNTTNGAAYANGYDELIVCRPNSVNPDLLEWHVLFNEGNGGSFSGWFKVGQFGLSNDRAVVGMFDGFRDSAAVVRPNPGQPGRSYVIWDINSNLVYDNGLDTIYGSWPVTFATKDRLLAGHFDGRAGGPAPAFSEDLAVWRDASGIWELYGVSVIGPLGIVPGNTPLATVQFGLLGDLPLCGDINGDGYSDLMVFRPSNNRLYINFYETGATLGGYGPTGDVDKEVNYNDAIVFNGGGLWNLAAVSLSYTGPACYANCDCSAGSPMLNINDFTCFLNKFAAQDPYANCDGSIVPPVLNVNDFICFNNKFAAGCP